MNKIVIFVLLLLIESIFSFCMDLVPDVSVSFFDVGQGDSAIIQTTQNQRILIDGGPDSKILSALGSTKLPFIDLIILTHPHADHINGLLLLLERVDIGLVIYGETEYESSNLSTFYTLCDQLGICRSILGRYEIRLSANETLILFAPPCPAYANVNNCSIVTKFSYLDFSVLFMGDSEKDEEQWLIKNYQDDITNVDVLKAGHHCSKTASSEALVVLVSPDVAVCSCGVGNKFGHPHKETLDVFYKYNVKVLRTDEIGTIVLKH
ncbi:MBL fold metallo-hydrolase [Candidatus Dojkabacteria bacterium]|nr:MBL fold metallo-hydrolase [Candidatus Dojkabacteria bacterium]